jgi:hypothetical protein
MSATEIAECIDTLVSMGFAEADAVRAVGVVGPNLEAALQWSLEADAAASPVNVPPFDARMSMTRPPAPNASDRCPP